MGLIRISAMTMLLVLASSPTSSAVVPSSEQKALPWLTASAHSFSDEASADDELGLLVSKLAGARVVGIGEATHGTHEDAAFKVELIKALVRRGQIDTVAFEANRGAVAGLNTYIQDGTGDPMSLIMSPGLFKIFKTEEFAGLVTWLRSFNRTSLKKVRLIGVDIQDSSVDLNLALNFLTTVDAAAADKFRSRLSPLVTNNGPGVRLPDFISKAGPEDWKKAYEASSELEASLVNHSGEWKNRSRYNEALYAATVARQGIHSREYDARNVKWEDRPAEALNLRDRYMAANLLGLLGSGGRAALWAHDSHVSRAEIEGGFRPIGYELSKALTDGYVVVGFAWSRGAFNSSPTSDGSTRNRDKRPPFQPVSARNDRPLDIGGALEKVGKERFWIDLADLPSAAWTKKWLSRPYYRGWAGAIFDRENWQVHPDDQLPLKPGLDILVYFREITPTRLLPSDQ